jgi:hypothetical protein
MYICNKNINNGIRIELYAKRIFGSIRREKECDGGTDAEVME